MRRFLDAVLGKSSPLVLSRLLSAALTFGLPLVLVRLLAPAAFGTYKQFFLVVTSLLLVGPLGLTHSLTYFLPRGAKERGSYVSQALLLLGSLALIFGLGLYAATPRLALWMGAGELAGLRLPLALTAALLLLAAPVEPALVAEGRIRSAALAYVLSDAVRAGLLVAAARWGIPWLGPAAIFWAAAVVGALRLAALIMLVVWRVLPVARPARVRLWEQLRFALPLAGASLFYVGQRYTSQYLVSARFATALFPIFTIAYFHMAVVDIVFTPITEVLMVALGRTIGRDPRAALAEWHDAMAKLASILLPAAAGAWLLGPTMLPLLFTHQYLAAVPLFMLATLEIPLSILPVDAVLRAGGDTRFLLGFNAVRIVATVGLVLFGIAHAGLAGAVLGGFASEALARIAMLVRARRFLGRPGLARLCDWPALGRIALAAAFACVPAGAVRLFAGHGLRMVLLSMAVYGAAYFAARSFLATRLGREAYSGRNASAAGLAALGRGLARFCASARR